MDCGDGVREERTHDGARIRIGAIEDPFCLIRKCKRLAGLGGEGNEVSITFSGMLGIAVGHTFIRHRVCMHDAHSGSR